MSDKDTQQNNDEQPPPTLIEWGVRGLSALALVALFGFLIHGAMQPEVGPNFVFEVKRDAIEQRRNGWAVPLTITNRGTVAIADVAFEARVHGKTDVKRGRIAIFGAGESVNTEIWFDEDPGAADIDLTIDTYTL